MPDGVAFPLQAGSQIALALHFVNGGSSPEQPQVKVNFLRSAKMQYEAAAMVSFNTMIDIPAATAAGPGKQTVSGSCSAPAGSHFFAIGTHTNAHATAADVTIVSGGAMTNVVHTSDWANPDVAVWTAPQFLTLQGGDYFVHSCAYSNDGATAVALGRIPRAKCA